MENLKPCEQQQFLGHVFLKKIYEKQKNAHLDDLKPTDMSSDVLFYPTNSQKLKIFHLLSLNMK